MMPASGNAQRVSRDYHDMSMSKALIDLDRASSRYHISFIYNELEDFTVTKHLDDRPVLDAVRDIVGFYPISISVGDSIIAVECVNKAERRLIGQLVDENGHPVIFANIQLLSIADTTFITGGVTNENGQFVIPCQEPKVRMRASCVGLKTLERIVEIGEIGEIRMQGEEYAINGVVVKGHHRVDKVDRSVFTFSDEQKKISRQTQEILTTLPGLRYDVQTGTLKSMTGKSMKILVNGVEATDNDLKSIPVDKIKNVEYYTIPPARYADVGTLINIKTQPLDAGYAAGFDVMQAAWVAFNNTNLYVRYNKGNHQVAFDYSMQYRNNANCESVDSYVFTDGTTVSDYLYRGDYHFGYCNQDFNLKYIYNKENDFTFQAKFSPNLFTQFWRTDNVIEANNNPQWQDGGDDWRGKCAVSVRRSTSISTRSSRTIRSSQSMYLAHTFTTPKTTTINNGQHLLRKNPPSEGNGRLYSLTTICVPRMTNILSSANLPILSHGAQPTSRWDIRQRLPSQTIRYATCCPTITSMHIHRTTTTTIYTVKSAEN